MPSKKRRRQTVKLKPNAGLLAFFPLLFLTLILWILYRGLFRFPIWFDESLGKAIFFGLPVWLFVTLSGNKKVLESLDFYKIESGLLSGLAIGGLYGFVVLIVNNLFAESQIQSVLLFSSPLFWGEFLLAMLTAFWETLFFFSFVMTVIMLKFKHWSLLNQVLMTAGIFLIFHLPNTFLRFGLADSFKQIILLFLFAIGQSFIFSRKRNFYTLVLSHAIWGMVLLIHL